MDCLGGDCGKYGRTSAVQYEHAGRRCVVTIQVGSSKNPQYAYIVLKVDPTVASAHTTHQIQVLGMYHNEKANMEIQRQIGSLQNVVDCVLSQYMKTVR